MRLVALLLSVLVLAAPAYEAAAQALPAVGGSQLNITISPLYPRPYDTVTATVNSTLVDLTSSVITFSVNGKAVGEGGRSASFSLGGPGSKTVVSVSAKDSAGNHTAQLSIYPADVALVIEPTSTVPPFYLGAKLTAPEGNIRLIALPNFVTSAGKPIAPASLVYTWKLADRILEAQSGIGKSVLTATAPVRYRDARVTLTVATQDQSIVGQATAIISPVDPFLRIYKEDPLRGVDFANALSGTFLLAGDEESFRAAPFYFASTPQVSWTLNGVQSSSAVDLTVRTNGTSAGSALISARAGGAESRLTVQFGQSRSTGIFGL